VWYSGSLAHELYRLQSAELLARLTIRREQRHHHHPSRFTVGGDEDRRLPVLHEVKEVGLVRQKAPEGSAEVDADRLHQLPWSVHLDSETLPDQASRSVRRDQVA